MIRFFWMALAVWMGIAHTTFADIPIPPQIEDLYRADAAVGAITLDDGQSAIYMRQRVDQDTRCVI